MFEIMIGAAENLTTGFLTLTAWGNYSLQGDLIPKTWFSFPFLPLSSPPLYPHSKQKHSMIKMEKILKKRERHSWNKWKPWKVGLNTHVLWASHCATLERITEWRKGRPEAETWWETENIKNLISTINSGYLREIVWRGRPLEMQISPLIFFRRFEIFIKQRACACFKRN